MVRNCSTISRRLWRSPIGPILAAFASFLLPLADLAASPVGPDPSERRYKFDIPAGPAGAALAAVSDAAGLSIGWDGAASSFPVGRLRGTMRPEEAFRRLLAGSQYQARRVGPTAYRIERRPAPQPEHVARASGRETATEPRVLPGGVIVVTGQKRAQSLRDVPLSVAVIDVRDGDGSGSPSLRTARDVAASVDGLALTNLGPGRNRQFIRGVADSPFNGPSQSTVTVELDEARATFDAPNPDLRLVDVERVEILKGPQGPLHGSGALGGIYHIVTRKPDLSETGGSILVDGEAVEHGGVGGGAEGVLNLPIVRDRLAIRLVGYAGREGGWIDNVGRNRNANSTGTAGWRVALRWEIAPDWTIDLTGVSQDVKSNDSQYVVASGETVRRNARIAEPADNDFQLGAATLQGRLGGLKLLATGSHIHHDVNFTLDSTDASALFGLTGQSSFVDERRYALSNYELRVSPMDSARWVAGVSYLDTHSRNVGTISSTERTLVAESVDRRIRELAVFGEATVPLLKNVSATAGARLFRTIAENEAVEQAGGATDEIAKTIFSPSLSLSWNPRDGSMIYLRYARAQRPGGLAPAGQSASGRFDSDALGTFDLGLRTATAHRRLTLEASVFHTIWSHIQSDYLLPNGLVSTRNAGHGRIDGVELAVEWKPTAGLRFSAGATYLDAMLTRTEAGLKLNDYRLPVPPEFTVRLAGQYRFPLGPWGASLSAQANYIGRARLALDDSLYRKMGNYATTSAAIGATRDHLTLGAGIDNILGIRGDSFAFGNPFSIKSGRQYTPLRPRTVTVSMGWVW